MSWQLGGDGSPPDGGELIVAGSGPQWRAQVALVVGEQAVADLAVSGQPDPVARPAEGPGDRPDNADAARPAIDQEGLGGR